MKGRLKTCPYCLNGHYKSLEKHINKRHAWIARKLGLRRAA